MTRPSGSEADDLSVIEEILAGRVDAFEILLRRYEHVVFAIVGRHVPAGDVPEVAQDVFVRAYQGLGGFAGKGGFKQWISGIATRTCYDHWRSRYRLRERPLSDLTADHCQWLERATASDAIARHEAAAAAQFAREIIEWALARLSTADRFVLQLVHLEEYSVKEAASLLGWSTVNVKVRAYRARRKLEKSLREALKKNEGKADE